MCNKHGTDYTLMSARESLSQLYHDHTEHAERCCPSPRGQWRERLPELTAIQTVMEVTPDFEDVKRIFTKEFINYLDGSLEYSMLCRIKEVLEGLSVEDFMANRIPSGGFKEFRAFLDNFNEVRGMERKLVRNSPKITVLIQSAYAWIGHEHAEDSTYMRKFNDRGASEKLEFVLSAEPHRIVGMSSRGKFTSCQDWFQKKYSHSYHKLTHQSWATLNDPAYGVCFIRKVGDNSFEDMLARALVKVLPLPNGQVAVYICRTYAVSPHERTLRKAVEDWKHTLPFNYHVLRIASNEYTSTGENRLGQYYSGKESYQFELPSDGWSTSTSGYEQCGDCGGSGTERVQCDTCDGNGSVTISTSEKDCWLCDGDGRIGESRCWNCLGAGKETEGETEPCEDCDNGYVDRECDHCEGGWVHDRGSVTSVVPYNDHDNFFSYESDEGLVTYDVPSWLLFWDGRDCRDDDYEMTVYPEEVLVYEEIA